MSDAELDLHMTNDDLDSDLLKSKCIDLLLFDTCLTYIIICTIHCCYNNRYI